MGEEKRYEIIKSGGKEYVYELKEPGSIAEAIGDLITGPTRELKEIRTIKYRENK